jgi:hypothetical protein
LLIFPSGACDNGSVISPFRKGPFVAEKRLQPVVIKLDLNALVCLSFECVDELPRTILHLCSYSHQNVDLLVMPDFEPNEFLFTKHADKGNERWEIFAWAVRDAMSQASGLPLSETPMRLKPSYNDYICKYTDVDPLPKMKEYLESLGDTPKIKKTASGVFFTCGSPENTNEPADQ